MVAPRTGTVTFLFTDIEGSTGLWDREPQAMGPALGRHDAILRRGIRAHDGTVFKTVGDAFCAAFETAPAALAAAVDAQIALQSEHWETATPLRVRMAVHSGAVEACDGDYVGPPLNRLTRLLAAGHGGQVLLSLAAEELACDSLPPGCALKFLGEHRLRDLQRPEGVFQVLHPDLRSDFPPLRTHEHLPNNLPRQLTSFVGRDREIDELRRLIETTPLLTLTGPGGAGKTRLSLHVAGAVLDRYPDGVWLVELAPLTDPGLVPQTVATALGVREAPDESLLQTITEFIRARELLLVLDNCEHLPGACADLAHHLLRACPRLKILATSRAALGIAGETAWRVPSLALPDPESLPDADALAQFEAVRLFIDRAAAARPDFRITKENAPAVARICHRLDGIPLAIELAAARVSILSVPELAVRLESDAFRLLKSSSTLAPSRHQTLRAAIDWSFALLSEPEQQLFERLSTFAAGWTLDAAEAVCGYAEVGAGDVLELLSQLVEKSLVIAEPDAGDAARFRLLEPLREYGRERLRARGEEDAAVERHARCFLHLTERAEPELLGADQRQWLDRLTWEHGNLRAALRSFIDRHDVEGAERLIGAGRNFWFYRGHLGEGRAWLAEIFALEREVSPPLDITKDTERRTRHAKALHAGVGLAFAQGDYEAAESLGVTELQLRRRGNDQAAAANALLALGFVAKCRGQFALARDRLSEGVHVSRGAGDDVMLALNLASLADVAYDEGDYPVARAEAEEALDVARRAAFPTAIAEALLTLGKVSYRKGAHAVALAQLEHSLRLARELGRKSSIAAALTYLALVANAQGDRSLAGTRLREGLALVREIGDRLGAATALEVLVLLSADARRAAVLWGAARALREAIGAPAATHWQAELDCRVRSIETSLSRDVADAAQVEGSLIPIEQAVKLALETRIEDGTPEGETPSELLTPREREVAALVARGWKNREIAERLVITEKTAKNHVAHILSKLGLASRARLPALVTTEGWDLPR